MRVTKRQLRRLIAEMLEADHPSEVEAVADVWSGDPEGKARNLELDLDHPKVAGGEETTKEPEMMPRQEDLVSERRLRRKIRSLIREQATPDDVVAKVIVFGGEVDDYTRSDIAKMLDNKRMYVNADNLPKWIYMTGMMDSYPEVWRYLEKLVNHQGPAVTINVRSDAPVMNDIPRL